MITLLLFVLYCRDCDDYEVEPSWFGFLLWLQYI